LPEGIGASAEQAQDGFRQGRRIARRHQDASLPFLDGFHDAAEALRLARNLFQMKFAGLYRGFVY
jgi:hypothetical protein